jgi:hypothetical protein
LTPFVFNDRLAAETDGLHHAIEGILDLIEALAWCDKHHVKEPFRLCDCQQHIPFSTAEGDALVKLAMAPVDPSTRTFRSSP